MYPKASPSCNYRPSPDASLWYDFDKYLRGRGLSSMLAYTNGWYPSRNAGDREPRVVIPATSADPRNLFWQARSMNGTEPRYQSPYAMRGDALVIVWPKRPSTTSSAYCIVEGPCDALAAAETGFVGVALLGGHPSDEVLAHAGRLTHRSPRLLVSDNDSPALMATITAFFPGAKLLLPSPWKDLASVPLVERRKLLCGSYEVSTSV